MNIKANRDVNNFDGICMNWISIIHLTFNKAS